MVIQICELPVITEQRTVPGVNRNEKKKNPTQNNQAENGTTTTKKSWRADTDCGRQLEEIEAVLHFASENSSCQGK